MKVLSIQDISCYGQCSLTVALPILSAYGIETAILPSAVLSTHTSGFKDFTVCNLSDEMPKIIDHWKKEGIKFDCIYTGYIGDVNQFDYILDCKKHLLKDGGVFFVDPAMADYGKMYYGLGEGIVNGMRKICAEADYIIPNVTEASFLASVPYLESQTESYIDTLIKKLKDLGAKNVIISGVEKDKDSKKYIGASFTDGCKKDTILKEKQEKSYHGTGDIFSSVVLANLLNNKSLHDSLDEATDFVIDCIKQTKDDDSHWYGVKFEEVLLKKRKK